MRIGSIRRLESSFARLVPAHTDQLNAVVAEQSDAIEIVAKHLRRAFEDDSRGPLAQASQQIDRSRKRDSILNIEPVKIKPDRAANICNQPVNQPLEFLSIRFGQFAFDDDFLARSLFNYSQIRFINRPVHLNSPRQLDEQVVELLCDNIPRVAGILRFSERRLSQFREAARIVISDYSFLRYFSNQPRR